MTIQTINVGSEPNDGTGDSLRAAFGKVNENFTNIDGNLNFSTLDAASTPISDDDLFVVRQGDTNKKIPWADLSSDIIADAEAATAASASAAEAAQTGAEAARDTSWTNNKIYADTTAGLAGTTNGQYFSVPSTETAEHLILYLNNAGVAEEKKRYPSTAAIAFKQSTITAAFELGDTDGNLAVRVATGATLDVTSAGVRSSAVSTLHTTLKHHLAVSDGDGNLAFVVQSDGGILGTIGSALLREDNESSRTYDYDINFCPVYGQSLSVGQATPVSSTVQNYNNVMFTDGMRPQYDHVGDTDEVRYASFIPAVEELSGVNASLAETPCMGLGDSVQELLRDEDGISYSVQTYQMLLSAPGYGGTTIAQLSDGTVHYTRLMTQVTYGLSVANAAGKTFALQAVAWVQGESDYIAGTTQAAYLSAINSLVSDINIDAKAITGQTKDIPLITYQIASHKVNGRTTPNIALAQTQAGATNALVYVATPMYFFDYQSNNDNHLTTQSSRLLGAYLGLTYKRVVIDGAAWQPLQPISATRQGAIATIRFHVPMGHLVFDTDTVASNTNYGFELVDSSDSPLTISSVALRGKDTVRIVASSSIPSGAKIRYAWSGSGNVGRSVGPRGNLRDSQGDTIVFDKNGTNRPMHNWCVIFEQVI